MKDQNRKKMEEDAHVNLSYKKKGKKERWNRSWFQMWSEDLFNGHLGERVAVSLETFLTINSMKELIGRAWCGMIHPLGLCAA